MTTRTMAPRTRSRAALLRTGLVLAAVLGALDAITGVIAIAGSFFAPPAVGIAMLVLGIGTIALVPPAWMGRRWASWTIVAMRLLSACTALPAFFVPGVPVEAVLSAAVGIGIAVAVVVVILAGLARRS